MSTQSATPVTITTTAITKVREIMSQQELSEDERFLRVFVDGGGCGGPGFGLAFDRAQDDDLRFEQEGMQVVVDPMSLPYVTGATIDFVDTPEMQGFRVSNPNLKSGGCSSGSCGSGSCGSEGAPESGGGCGSGGCGCGSGGGGGHDHSHGGHGGHGGGCC